MLTLSRVLMLLAIEGRDSWSRQMLRVAIEYADAHVL